MAAACTRSVLKSEPFLKQQLYVAINPDVVRMAEIHILQCISYD